MNDPISLASDNQLPKTTAVFTAKCLTVPSGRYGFDDRRQAILSACAVSDFLGDCFQTALLDQPGLLTQSEPSPNAT
jgi:hypothetical protein